MYFDDEFSGLCVLEALTGKVLICCTIEQKRVALVGHEQS